MADPRLFRLRVVYHKLGRLALLSHLEVARALERTVRRAQLPFAVSQGFSPHMRIAFGAALPVGVAGEREIFDLYLERYVPPEQALVALSDASAPDLRCLACEYVEPRDAAASVAYPLSTYRAHLSFAPDDLSAPDTITVTRKRKEKTLVVADFLVGELTLDGACATFALEAKPTGSLRPDVFLRACVDAYNDAAGKQADELGEASATGKPSEASATGKPSGTSAIGKPSEASASGKLGEPSEPLRIVSIARTSQTAAL